MTIKALLKRWLHRPAQGGDSTVAFANDRDVGGCLMLEREAVADGATARAEASAEAHPAKPRVGKHTEAVIRAESEVLNSAVSAPYERRLVTLDTGDVVNTVIFGERDGHKPALVLAHGWGAGLGFYCHNLDALARTYRVFCFDWVGCGGSSRPRFNRHMSAEESERFFLDRFDEWTRRVGLDKERFILAGHSLGGYLAAVYALRHPHRLQGLALISPFGLPDPQAARNASENVNRWRTWQAQRARNAANASPAGSPEGEAPASPPDLEGPTESLDGRIPLRYRVARRVFRAAWNLNLTPQRFLRFASTFSDAWSRDLVQKYVDMRFAVAFRDPQQKQAIAHYLHAISVAPGSGEFAVKTLMLPGAWARLPLMHRLPALPPNLPVVYIYGDGDWMNPQHARELMQLSTGRGHHDMHLAVVPDSGHYLFLENPTAFNAVFLQSCQEHILKRDAARHETVVGNVHTDDRSSAS